MTIWRIGSCIFVLMENIFTDEYFMKKALVEAETAFENGEIPVGAIIVIDGDMVEDKISL